MLGKIALRNVKRQLGSYFIYFITVTLTVSLMFAVNNLMFSKAVKSLGEQIDITGMIKFVVVLVGIVSAVVLSYATSFMLKLRKREFGMYMMLGMVRKEILTLFTIETLVMSVMAIAVGIFTGLFIYQLVMMLLCSVMQISFEISAYSAEALLLTLGISGVVFIISSLASRKYLKKVRIADLLRNENNEKPEKNVPLSAVFATITLCGSVVFVYLIMKLFDASKGTIDGKSFAIYIVSAIVCVFFFHTFMARCFAGLLIRNRKRSSIGANIVAYRNISSATTLNSILVGALGTILTVAIAASNVSFTEKLLTDSTLDREVPFEYMFFFDANDPHIEATKEKALSIVSKSNTIAQRKDYRIYTTGLYEASEMFSNGVTWPMVDLFISVNDFNALMSELGEASVDLAEDEFFLVTGYKGLCNSFDLEKASFEIDGKRYRVAGKSYTAPDVTFAGMCFVAPEEALKNLKADRHCIVGTFAEKVENPTAVINELNDTLPESDDYWCRTILKSYAKLDTDVTNGVLIITMLYLSTVLVCLALAILSIKTLAGLNDDRARFEILYKLGLDSYGQRRLLRKQIFTFFALPFWYPFLMSLPIGLFCRNVYNMTGVENANMLAFKTGIAIDAVLIGIYFLYYLITEKIASDYVVKR